MITSLSRAAFAAAMVLSAVVGGTSGASAVSLAGTQNNFHPLLTDIYTPVTAGATLTSPPSVGGIHRSPFEFVDGTIDAAYTTVKYLVVQAALPATYNFAAGIDKFNLIWGSPDSYNTLEFFAGENGTGGSLGSFTIPGAPNGLGNVLAAFEADFGELIKSIRFTSGSPAFEFVFFGENGGGAGDVPLPPALILFGSALVGLTVLGRRRRAAKSVAAV